jgi:hypothetical protein
MAAGSAAVDFFGSRCVATAATGPTRAVARDKLGKSDAIVCAGTVRDFAGAALADTVPQDEWPHTAHDTHGK